MRLPSYDWRVMLIAITGGRGFIGSAVLSEALDRGHTVMPIDRSNAGPDIMKADLNFYLAKADVVIHLAGVLGTEELFSNPMDAINVNIGGATRVLESCRQTDTKYLGITMPDVWANVYQVTKRAAFQMAEAWRINWDVKTAHVLAYNAFGPGQKVHGVQKIIPTFAHRAWRGQPIQVWGTGHQIVDLIHVDDIARIFIDIAEGDQWDGQTVEAGTGTAHSVNAVVEYVNDYCKSREAGTTIQHVVMRKGEQDNIVVADGWGAGSQPTFSLEDLDETIEWYREDRP